MGKAKIRFQITTQGRRAGHSVCLSGSVAEPVPWRGSLMLNSLDGVEVETTDIEGAPWVVTIRRAEHHERATVPKHDTAKKIKEALDGLNANTIHPDNVEVGDLVEDVEALSDIIDSLAQRLESPSIMFNPRVFQDGNQWCALYGPDLQVGVAGFGDTPAEACSAFDQAWRGRRPAVSVGDRVRVLRWREADNDTSHAPCVGTVASVADGLVYVSPDGISGFWLALDFELAPNAPTCEQCGKRVTPIIPMGAK